MTIDFLDSGDPDASSLEAAVAETIDASMAGEYDLIERIAALDERLARRTVVALGERVTATVTVVRQFYETQGAPDTSNVHEAGSLE